MCERERERERKRERERERERETETGGSWSGLNDLRCNRYDALYDPLVCFHMELKWLVASGSTIDT